MKIQLKDLTFLVITKLDTIERLENTIHIVDHLYENFETKIIVWEFAYWNNGVLQSILSDKVQYQFIKDLDPIFHRTRFLNSMIDLVQTEFVSVWDVDVVIPNEQIIKAIEYLRNGADVVYPFDHFYDTTDDIRRWYLENSNNIDILKACTKYMNELYTPAPVGGAFMLRTSSYINSGKENKNYYGWGYEDGDRYYKWVNYGFNIKRIKGPLYHLSHPRGLNSSIPHPDFGLQKKRELFNTIRKNHE